MQREDKKLKARVEKEKKSQNIFNRKQDDLIQEPRKPGSGHNLASSIGNKGLETLFQGLVVQAKLRVSQPGDRYEQEADNVADRIVREEDSPSELSASISKGSTQGATATKTLPGEMDSRLKSMHTAGSPLNQSIRDYFEPRFGVDLGNVSIHTGNKAEAMAGVLNARAITYGSNIAFAKGEFQPGTAEGRKLLAHELTHVQQQSSRTVFRFIEHADIKEDPDVTMDEILAKDEKIIAEQELEDKEKALDQQKPDGGPEEQEPSVEDMQEAAGKAKEKTAGEEKKQASGGEKEQTAGKEKQEAAPPPPSTAAAFGGGGGGGGAPAEAANLISASNPGEVISQLKDVKPSQSVAAFNQGKEEGAKLLSEEQDTVLESIPEIKAPTGLPPVAAAGTQQEPAISTPPPVKDFQTEKDSGKGKEISTKVNIPEGAEMKASLGEAPTVDLSGAADPGQMQSFNSEAAANMNGAQELAQADMQQDFGEKNIFPEVADEIIQVEKQKAEIEITAEKLDAAPTLSADAAVPFDLNVGPVLQGKIAEQEAQFNQEKDQYDQQAAEAKLETDEQIVSLNEEAARKQLEQQEKAGAEVEGYKEEWREEVAQVEADFQSESDKVTAEHKDKIACEQQKGEDQAAEHYREAQARADAEKQKAREKANKESEKKKSEEKKGGILGFLQDVGNAIVEGLKTIVNAIFEALKAVIKFIFEAAKKLALAAIELARKAITLYIKAYGAVRY